MKKNELESIQIEAVRIGKGVTKLVSIKSLYKETGWEHLKTRRNKHNLILYHKIVLSITPSCLCSFVPAIVDQITSHNLRNTNALRSILCKSQLYFNYFLPKPVCAWNDLKK